MTDYFSPPYKAKGGIIEISVCVGKTSFCLIYRCRRFGMIRCFHTPQKHNIPFCCCNTVHFDKYLSFL
jgi:hypothetical protein